MGGLISWKGCSSVLSRCFRVSWRLIMFLFSFSGITNGYSVFLNVSFLRFTVRTEFIVSSRRGCISCSKDSIFLSKLEHRIRSYSCLLITSSISLLVRLLPLLNASPHGGDRIMMVGYLTLVIGLCDRLFSLSSKVRWLVGV